MPVVIAMLTSMLGAPALVLWVTLGVMGAAFLFLIKDMKLKRNLRKLRKVLQEKNIKEAFGKNKYKLMGVTMLALLF